MNKFLLVFGIMALIRGTPLFAQADDLDQFKQIDRMDADKKAPGTPAPDATKNPAGEQEPTIITASKESSFDLKSKTAIFVGDVHVKNPQFTLSSDKMTVYFHKDENTGHEAGAKPATAPKGDPPAPAVSSPQAGSIEKVVAEGNVVVESDHADANGGAPVHYVGKAEKLEYIPATGEAVFTGWPQVQQGINTMVAKESSTVIHLNRDGTMHAEGPVEMQVHDPGPDKATPAPGKSAEVK